MSYNEIFLIILIVLSWTIIIKGRARYSFNGGAALVGICIIVSKIASYKSIPNASRPPKTTSIVEIFPGQ